MSQDLPVSRSFPLRHRLISALQNMDVKGIRWLAHRLPGWLLPEPGGRCIMKTLHGFRLAIDPVRDPGVDRNIYYTGTYERGSLAVMKRVLKKGDAFVDAGANIGLMSLHASTLVGPSGVVWAFEPNPETAGILRENVILNKRENIRVSEYALGKEQGTAVLYESPDSKRGAATLIPPGEQGQAGEQGPPGEQGQAGEQGPPRSHQVRVNTLASLFREGRAIKMIKLDIEGYELEALEGARPLLDSGDPPFLMVECSRIRANTHGETTDALWDFLTGLGHYRIYKGNKDKSRVSKLMQIRSKADMPGHDNIYCLTRLHAAAMGPGIFREPWNEGRSQPMASS